MQIVFVYTPSAAPVAAPGNYPRLKRSGRAAFMIRWWPAIKRKTEHSAAGEGWRIDMTWSPDDDRFVAVRDRWA